MQPGLRHPPPIFDGANLRPLPPEDAARLKAAFGGQIILGAHDPALASTLPPPADVQRVTPEGAIESPPRRRRAPRARLAEDAASAQPGAAVAAAPARAGAPVYRVCVGVGRGDAYMIGIEEAPDWDLVGSMTPITKEALQQVLPVLAKLAKIKDLTGELDELRS